MNRTWVIVFVAILGLLIGWLIGSHYANKLADNKLVHIDQSTYTIAVDYSQSLDQMIKAGCYDYISSDINERNFPLTKKSGKSTLDIELIHFDRVIDSNEAIEEIDKLGLRPAKLPEFLALGAQYPELQQQISIVTLGSSVWQDPDSVRDVPCLWGVPGKRGLGLTWFGGGWGADCRFAVVRKSR